MRKIKIMFYKWKLKSAYIKYKTNTYSCGSYLQNYILGDKDDCNRLIRKLQSLGEKISELK